MIVNLLGNPNDFDKINNIIKAKDILLIEDNCESMGLLLMINRQELLVLWELFLLFTHIT